MARARRQALLGIALTAAAALLATPVVASGGTNPAASATTAAPTTTSTAGSGVATAAACPAAVPADHVRCFARVLLESRGGPAVHSNSAAPVAGSYGPADLQSAYSIGSGGAGHTVGIVDVYDDPNAESDLGVYRATYGLGPCTTANGCFRKVNINGAATGNVGWAQEISLDLDMVSASCPACHILLVEVPADSSGSASAGAIGQAVNTAVQLGASEVSLSLGSGEFAGETVDDRYFDHPGVAVTVASGDSGYGTSFPATSADVIAVGGTSLRRTTALARGWTETAWSGTGAGCSQFEPKPIWQHDTGCLRRTDNDLAVVADPATGVAVYDSYGVSGWGVVGGTSVGAPLVAGMQAVSGHSAAFTGAQGLYGASAVDVVSGSDGVCVSLYLCTAVPGYDGPTGLGVILGSSDTGGTSGGGGGGTTASTPPRPGYWLVARDGGIFAFGGAEFDGSTGGMHLNQPIVGMAATPGGHGYWLVARDGGIFSFGDAAFHGSTGAIQLNQPIVGMAATPSGNGYWLVASDGGIFSFGDAHFFGSTGAMHLNQPIVGMATTPDGGGYWLVAADGGIFSFGDAHFRGSTGAIHLNQPIVGMARTPSGNGYWLVASDGGIFAFGDAAFHGSTGAMQLNQPIVGMAPTASGSGYWLVAADGGIFCFGDAGFQGSTGGERLNQPIVSMAATAS